MFWVWEAACGPPLRVSCGRTRFSPRCSHQKCNWEAKFSSGLFGMGGGSCYGRSCMSASAVLLLVIFQTTLCSVHELRSSAGDLRRRVSDSAPKNLMAWSFAPAVQSIGRGGSSGMVCPALQHTAAAARGSARPLQLAMQIKVQTGKEREKMFNRWWDPDWRIKRLSELKNPEAQVGLLWEGAVRQGASGDGGADGSDAGGAGEDDE
eukprot:3301447-Rhodomonas_salina.2